MKVFDDYAEYYDLLYKNKDYRAETNYITRLIKKYLSNARTILDLGCGTGRYDFLLAKKGYHILGVDRSGKMLDKARETLSSLRQTPKHIEFHRSDIRTLRLNRRFDVVLSLFHVFSYQTSNDDLKAAFDTVKKHLRKGGVFIFDCWYGPAVLTDRPVVRLKRMEDTNVKITRIAEPVMHANDNVVDVNYQILICDNTGRHVNELHETHKMRYLFKPELDNLLFENGLEMLAFEEWMTGKSPGFDTWNTCVVGKY